ncbi:hypothetical protein UFOVP909_108 [uncultured Caudovirales phage]|uniref:Uncharacterized protein n=1 Tax=uncultured Caudovirales phage TaxID=2100421 RepID=A0A6J5RMB1_9CAUD|nr:hypothetical protein UFOVP909_108 [uncultured Caudovirales phage]CAB4182172.1 hypothetical protein UFOVP1066_163 [uncultured Caudovirales phage]CAB4198610.1 hypothetical protein UFOVP1315_174 [uncultured Caudovirales phage]CAB4211528.1 hypothetical protein UFOVP1421_135 [uncultured Caudovirales phage]CAB5238641.1 hypothetical protein UFOVP1525_145 [uncultured Caudovirales phage]
MELVLQKQSNQLAQSGSKPISSSGGGGGGSGAAGGMGNLAQELITSLQDLTSGIRKLVTTVQFNTRALSSVPAAGGGDGKGLENEIEGNRSRDIQSGLLLKIEENTRGMGGKKDDKKKDSKDDSSWLGNIAKFGLVIAGALGAIAGLFMAQFKTMKFFASLLADGAAQVGKALKGLAKFLGLDGFGASIAEKFKQVVTFVDGIVDTIKSKITRVGGAIASFFEESVSKFKKYFSFFEDSKIGQILKSIGTFISDVVGKFVAPFKDAFSALSGDGVVMKIIKSIKDFFGGIGEYFGKFASVFGAVSKIVSKIFVPIQIIMGIFDTVSGAIDGFKKEGVLGAIQGGITGLINGVFMSFFDLVKDGISWILSAIGFDDAAKFLDSFTFSDLFASLMDKIFHPIRTLQEAFDGLDLKALIFEPMAKAWAWLNESLGGIPQKIVDNIDLYIIQPLANIFAPVTKMFSDMAAKVIGFFKEFSIPGVSIKIPFKDDPLKIGPWYPFKGDTKSESGGGDAAKPAAAAGDTKGATPVTASETNKVSTVAPTEASNVTAASKTNAESALARAQTVGNNTSVVNAPVMTNNKTTQIIKPPIRNTEPSVNSYLRSRLVT